MRNSKLIALFKQEHYCYFQWKVVFACPYHEHMNSFTIVSQTVLSHWWLKVA